MLTVEILALVRDRKILIADADPARRFFLSKLVTELGFDSRMIFVAKNGEEAVRTVAKHGVRTILLDDSIERTACQAIRRFVSRESVESTFIFLLTARSSHADVADAVESGVDGFALKPYSATELKNRFLETLQAKVFPDDYRKILHLGRNRLSHGDLEQADRLFEKAKGLDTAPAAAHFYAGQVKAKLGKIAEAKEEFKAGLEHNQIHGGCLAAMYQLTLAQGKVGEAYEVLRRLAPLFPNDPARLQKALALAVRTGNFTDVNGWFEVYESLPEKSRDLQIAMGSALCVLGRHYANAEKHVEAADAFAKALGLGVHESVFLDYAVESFQRVGMMEAAIRLAEAHTLAS